MRKNRSMIFAVALFASALLVSAAFAAMGKIENFTLSTVNNKDIAGTGGAIAADGVPDAEFTVRISGTAGALSGFSLKNVTTGQEWAASGGKNVLVVVDSKGSVVNSSFPKVAFLLAADFKLYVNDRVSLTAAGGEFELTVRFVDNSTATSRLAVDAEAPVQEPAPGSTVPAVTPTTPATPASGNAKLISAEFKGVGNYDLSDGTKKLGSNMSPDYRFDISLAGEDLLSGIRIRATGGGASEKTWDTVATTSNPLVVVTDQGKGTPLNAADGSISIPVKDLRDLSLWIDGNDDLKKQDYRLTLLFAGGRIEESDIKQAAPPQVVSPGEGRNRGEERRQRGIERSVRMAAKPVQIKIDAVGKNRKKQVSGMKDFSLMVNVRGEGTISAVSVVNQIGKGRWDTIPGSGAWLTLVRKGGSQVNNTKDFSVSIPIKGNESLELLMEDDGTLSNKEGRLLLSITWDDGEVTEELLTW